MRCSPRRFRPGKPNSSTRPGRGLRMFWEHRIRNDQTGELHKHRHTRLLAAAECVAKRARENQRHLGVIVDTYGAFVCHLPEELIRTFPGLDWGNETPFSLRAGRARRGAAR